MTKKILQDRSLDSNTTLNDSTIIATPTTTDDMHTHRMGSVLEERRDPNFNSWTEIIPERVKHAAKG